MKQTRGKQKQKITADYAIGDMYKSYIKNLDSIEKESGYIQPRAMYGNICRDFNEEISNIIITEAFEFRMPFRTGDLRIRKKKKKPKFNEDGTMKKGSLPPNWKATKELWAKDPKAKAEKKLVYFTNEHTNGYIHSFYYDRSVANYKNQSVYLFKPTRTNDRNVTVALFNPDIKIDHYE